MRPIIKRIFHPRNLVCLVVLLLTLIVRPLASQTIDPAPTSSTQTQTAAVTPPAQQPKPPRPDTPAFEVVSIRPSKHDPNNAMGVELKPTPDGYKTDDQTIWATIMLAYSPLGPLYWSRDQMLGAPPWLIKNGYSIQAKVSSKDIEAWQRQGLDHQMLSMMLRSMLADRCKLVLHIVTANKPIYALTAGKHALKLKETTPGPLPEAHAVSFADGGEVIVSRGDLSFFGASMADLATFLTGGYDRPILDMTGLKGKYDFVLTAREQESDSAEGSSGLPPYIVEDLGLVLKAMMAPTMTVVIDHVEPPSEN
jgi:uncharacterized protein (TIGR03435 family)